MLPSSVAGLALALLGPSAPGLAASPAAAAPPVEWVVEDGSTLILRLVTEEGRRVCGGELTVDPSKRSIRFEGAPGEIGCLKGVEVRFADVKALRGQRREAGFVLELADNGRKLVLLPLPHFRWFVDQYRVRQGTHAIENQLAAVGGLTMAGADGAEPMNPGGTAGLSLEKVDLPAEVVADTRRAVDLIREAMGRTPAPANMVREILEGRPVDASLSELVNEAGSFSLERVRVRGRAFRTEAGTGLRLEAEGISLPVEPEAGAEARIATMSAWIGQEVELVGRLRRRLQEAATTTRVDEHYLEASECLGPERAGIEEGVELTLSALLARMKEYQGEVVRVVGRFRGRNHYGDLPTRSQRGREDWVIKSERAAVWVTGHKPGGEGWGLDLDTPGSSEWLEIVGRPRVRNGVAYLRAMTVALVAAPPGARVVPARRLLGRHSEPPSVVFSLPLEGEAVEAATRIIVQFDRDMDEESFKDRVRLRGEEGSEIAVRLLYDESRRSLVINPLRPLRAGRPLRVELLPGIVDLEGVPLAPRPGRAAAGEVVDVLRYGS